MLSLEEMGAALMVAAAATRDMKPALELVGQVVEAEAKRVIGTYDLGWPALKPETVARKTTGDRPLLETGEMRDSIGHSADSTSVSIGSNDDKAVWQELGTAHIPPRSFLLGSAVRKEGEILQIIGKATQERLSPK